MVVAASAIWLVVGSQLPKSGTAGYATIIGTTKDKEAVLQPWYYSVIQIFEKEIKKEIVFL